MIKKYLKDMIYGFIILGLFTYNMIYSNNVSKMITHQDITIMTLSSKLNERANTPDRVIISCANNQKDYLKVLKNTEKKFKLPEGLLVRVAYVESNFDPHAMSHKGALGIMQLHPKWHPEVNPRDPYDAIPYSAKYLTYLKKRFGTWELALAAWNWGEGNMEKYAFLDAPRETKNFVKRVMQELHV